MTRYRKKKGAKLNDQTRPGDAVVKVTTTRTKDGYIYRITVNGKPSFSSGKPLPRSELHKEIQGDLRMLDKCGWRSKFCTRSRYRYWEKLDKLRAWKEKCREGKT